MWRCEGPHCFVQKRPRPFVSALQSIAAVEASKNQLLRDFRYRSIFDFCNTIRQKLSFESALINSGDVQTHANLIFNENREFYLRTRFSFRVLRTIKTSPSSVKFATCTIPSLPWACRERVLL